jgi:hydrogenase-4 transcriptional activator
MLLHEVWREVSRHVEIAAAVERIAQALHGEMPVTGMVVRRLDRERMRLETVASSGDDGSRATGRARTELNPSQARALLAWGRAGSLVRGRSGVRHPLLELAAADHAGDVMAGPLVDDGQTVGVLLLLGERHAFGEAHEPFARSLLEPMAVALRNDMRLHELSRLRESLEADKQALLSRLGRQEITEAIVGAEAGLRSVMTRVAQVAPTDAPVLLLGETGSGKEVVAREIHRLSARASGPVVRVNCGAIAPGLIDSELFGHERGSFTGAVSDRAGWFERADGGTLFLDEIGELPLDAQVRLLRVLQDGTFERVGGRRTHQVDVRIVAATHRDLYAMVRAGTFREDLWYRIGVFPVHLPPLRERPEDIPELAAHFAWRAGQRLRGAPLAPIPADIDRLLAYPWPGNVRELAAVIERAAILGGGKGLDVAAALGPAAPSATDDGRTAAVRSLAPEAERPFPTLDDAMTLHIQRALEIVGGRIEGPHGAAKLLGINPHTLRARMRKLGIAWTAFRVIAGTGRVATPDGSDAAWPPASGATGESSGAGAALQA